MENGDTDNFLKGFLDALYEKDGHIWDIRGSKFWAEKGAIEIVIWESPEYWEGLKSLPRFSCNPSLL